MINPILRGLIAPQTPIHLTMDTASDMWAIDGDIILKGGEVFYLGRNFYLKEGRVVLNETQDNFDPLVTVRAETRTHDSSGSPVTITLSAANQKVSEFSPSLTSNPAKSESEVLSLLGSVLTGDSESVTDALVAGGDFMFQNLIIRKAENSLRDLLNFDILSLRMTLIQNAVKYGLNSSSENSHVASNYFDNTAVYIGKYFGEDVYADALLQWSYDESLTDSFGMVAGGLVFQPELGLEFSAPFANIRWQFAPDMGALQNSWVPATSVTLSWQLQF